MPPFPTALGYLWKTYFRLRRRCSVGFSGPNPLSWRDIDAFTRQTRFALAPWEVDIIERLDDAYLQPIARRAAAQRAQQATPNMIPATDTAGVRSLLRGVAGARKKKGG